MKSKSTKAPIRPAPDPNGPLRCCLYARVSTQEQADKGLSIPAQIRECQGYAARAGWHVPSDLIFQDAGISGTRADRPGLQDMLAAADNGAFDVLLVHASDRLSRDEYFALGVKMAFKNLGILMRSVTEPFFGGSHPMDPVMESVTRAGHAMYIARLVGEIHKGQREIAAQGRQTGQCPYGYRYHDPARQGSGWIVEEAEAAWVRHIFTEFAGGSTAADIARQLNAAGVPTYSQANAASPRGRTRPRRTPAICWLPQTILKMLSNRSYLGEIIYRGDPLPGAHPPLVEAELFEQVQALKIRRGKGRVEHSDRGLFVGGLLRCPLCGAAMHHIAARWPGYTGAGGGEEYRSNYRCGSAHRRSFERAAGAPPAEADCPGFMIGQKRALRLLRTHLLGLMKQDSRKEQASRKRAGGVQSEKAFSEKALSDETGNGINRVWALRAAQDREKRRGTVLAELARQERQRQGYFDLVAGGDMRIEEMRAAMERLEARRLETEAELATLEMPLNAPAHLSGQRAEELLAVLDDSALSLRQKRDALRLTLECFIVLPDRQKVELVLLPDR